MLRSAAPFCLSLALVCLVEASTCTGSSGRTCTSPTIGTAPVLIQLQASQRRNVVKSEIEMQTCPSTEAAQSFGDVTTSQLDECSGLAASRVNPGVYWSNDDSGASPRLYGIKRDGTHVARLYVHGSHATDWEDIAVGPGPEEGASYIYIADTGDNYRSRRSVQIYRAKEPQVPEGRDRNRDIPIRVERFDISYPTGSHDCEAMFIDQGDTAKQRGTAGRVYIITKGDNRNSDERWAGGDVFFVDLPHSSAHLQFQPTNVHLPVEWVTGADLSPDGKLVGVRSYGEVLMWARANGTSVEKNLHASGCKVDDHEERQGEAIAFGANGDHYITVSEGKYPPVWYFGLSEAVLARFKMA